MISKDEPIISIKETNIEIGSFLDEGLQRNFNERVNLLVFKPSLVLAAVSTPPTESDGNMCIIFF